MPRILVIHPDKGQCSDIKFLLFLHGYQAETCDTLVEGLNRFVIFEKLERSFDLVLLLPPVNHYEGLTECVNSSFLEKLVVVCTPGKNETERLPGGMRIKTCRSDLLIDYIRDHLKQPATNKVNMSSLDSCRSTDPLI